MLLLILVGALICGAVGCLITQARVAKVITNDRALRLLIIVPGAEPDAPVTESRQIS